MSHEINSQFKSSDQQQRSSSPSRRTFDYSRNQAQSADHPAHSPSSKSPENAKNKKRTESTRDASTTTSTEQAASKRAQSSGLRHCLKTVIITAFAATAKAREVHANQTAVVEGMRPVVYGLPGQ